MGFLKSIFKKIIGIPKALVKDVGRSIKGSLEGDPMAMVKLATYVYGGYQGMSYLSNSAALSTGAVSGASGGAGVFGGVGAGSATGQGTVFQAFGGSLTGSAAGSVSGFAGYGAGAAGGAGWGAAGSAGTSFFTGGGTNAAIFAGGRSPFTSLPKFQQTWAGAAPNTTTYGPAYKGSFFSKVASKAKQIGGNQWFKSAAFSYKDQKGKEAYRNLQASYNTNYQKLLAQYQTNAKIMGNRNSSMYDVQPRESGFAKVYHIPNMGKYLERATGINSQNIHAHNAYLRDAITNDFRRRNLS